MNPEDCYANIGPDGIRKRRIGGIVAILVGIALVAVLIALQQPRTWRALAFAPFWLGALGWFQAREKTCVGLASRGLKDLDGGDGMEPVIDEAERVLEALLVGLTGGASHTQSPLPDQGGAVPRVAEDAGDRDVFGSQGNLGVAAYPRVTGVHPRHQHRARRRAHSASRVVVGEADTFGRQPIDARSREFPLPVGAYIAVAEIISLNEDDVWRA